MVDFMSFPKSPEKRKLEDDKEREFDKRQRMFQKVMIGLKDGQSSFEVDEIKKMRKDVQKETGFPWKTSEGEQQQQPYPVEWMDKQDNRRRILENQKDYQFLTKVAGFSDQPVENFFFMEDVSAINLRNNILLRQTQSNIDLSALSIKELEQIADTRKSRIKDLKVDISSVESKKSRLGVLRNVVQSMTDHGESLLDKLRFERIRTLFKKYLTLIDTISPVVVSDINLKIERDGIEGYGGEVIKPDTISDYTDLIDAEVRAVDTLFDIEEQSEIEKYLVNNLKQDYVILSDYYEEDEEKLIPELDNIIKILIKTLVDITDYYFYKYDEKGFSEYDKKKELQTKRYLDNKLKFVKKYVDIDVPTKLNEIKANLNVTGKSIIDQLLLFYIVMGSSNDSMEVLTGINQQFSPIVSIQAVGIRHYIEWLILTYSVDASVLLTWTNNSSYDFINLFIEKTLIQNLLRGLAASYRVLVPENNDFQVEKLRVNYSSIEIISFMRSFEAKYNTNDWKKYATPNFMTRFSNLSPSTATKPPSVILDRVQHPYLFIFRYSQAILDNEINQKTSELKEFEKELKEVERRIYGFTTGKAKLSDVELPYKQRRGWVEDPENSGIVRVKPYIVSAIAAAHLDVERFTKFKRVDIEALQHGEKISTDFARLVAVHIRDSKLGNPKQHYPRNQKLLNITEKQSIIQAINKYYYVEGDKLKPLEAKKYLNINDVL